LVSKYLDFDIFIGIGTPQQVRARNDTEGYYPMLQTHKVSPTYLNWSNTSLCGFIPARETICCLPVV
jgi:hypothetical protein